MVPIQRNIPASRVDLEVVCGSTALAKGEKLPFALEMIGVLEIRAVSTAAFSGNAHAMSILTRSSSLSWRYHHATARPLQVAKSSRPDCPREGRSSKCASGGCQAGRPLPIHPDGIQFYRSNRGRDNTICWQGGQEDI